MWEDKVPNEGEVKARQDGTLEMYHLRQTHFQAELAERAIENTIKSIQGVVTKTDVPSYAFSRLMQQLSEAQGRLTETKIAVQKRIERLQG